MNQGNVIPLQKMHFAKSESIKQACKKIQRAKLKIPILRSFPGKIDFVFHLKTPTVCVTRRILKLPKILNVFYVLGKENEKERTDQYALVRYRPSINITHRKRKPFRIGYRFQL